MLSRELILKDLSGLISDLNFSLPAEYLALLESEFSAAGESTGSLELIEKNCLASRSGRLPLCQDCGFVSVLVEKGHSLKLDFQLSELIDQAVSECYCKLSLRKSIVKSPLLRENTGTNTPALIHFEEIPGKSLKISLMLKGGGSENIAFAEAVNPDTSSDGLADFIERRIGPSLPNACPPLIIGVGLGGNLELASALSKKALFRKPGERSPKAHLSEFEEKLKLRLNSLGCGPFGLKGKLAVLSVQAEESPCHIACFPVAVNAICHSYRVGELSYQDPRC
ncbi:MAG: fumarate hydratase [Candidatus Wallbacteria bacterium]|nr:fumarate hydratase [Candidatus Wallbacteria bacterium]